MALVVLEAAVVLEDLAVAEALVAVAVPEYSAVLGFLVLVVPAAVVSLAVVDLVAPAEREALVVLAVAVAPAEAVVAALVAAEVLAPAAPVVAAVVPVADREERLSRMATTPQYSKILWSFPQTPLSCFLFNSCMKACLHF